MKTSTHIQRLLRLTLALSVFVGLQAAATDISTVPLDTYSAPASTDVKPNLLFVLDDSGSMDWDYMPDWANSGYVDQFRNAGYNGLAYNPAIVYTPPVSMGSGGVAGQYPSMTGTSSTTGGDSAATSSAPNWAKVKDDAYGVQSTSTSDLTPGTNTSSKSFPYFFTTIPGEFCTSSSLKNCSTTSTATSTYGYPSYLRWCDSTALTNCKAGYDSASFTNARMPTHSKATITVSGNTSTSVTSITVDGQEIMQSTAAQSSSSKTLATNIANQINNCTYTATGACAGKGYIATVSASVVTIYAPGDSTSTPVVTPNINNGMTFAVSAFSKGTAPGQNILTTITPSNNSYPYPGTTTKAITRTDCAGTTCTRNEEMTNYANWWTYYRTRMQMMKTSVSNAFAVIDAAADISNGVSRYRVGYMTINGNQSNAFLNLGEFTGSQKYNWYQKLINANPGNSTPLRQALSDAGRLYAGKLNGSTLNGVNVTDPLQYSCQQNYTLLSTDGFWNSGAGYKMDGSTAVGNQDGGDNAPYGDGGTASQPQIATSTLQTRSTGQTLQSSTSQLQSRTVNSTSTAPSIQIQTSSDSGQTWSSWSTTTSCSPKTTGNNRRNCQFYKSTSSDGGNIWTAFVTLAVNTTCTAVTNSVACTGTVVTSATAWTNTNSCTSSSTVQCQYVDDTAHWVNTDSCTSTKPASSPYTVGLATICQTLTGTAGTWADATGPCTATVATACQYSAWSSWSNTTSCTAIAQSSSPNYTVLNAAKCQTLAATGGTSDTLADVAAYYYKTDLRSPTVADGTGTCTGPIISPSTTANDLCANNVPPNPNGRDVAVTQHMTTFTLGLGAEGKMVYAPTDPVSKDYWKDTSGDFFSIAQKKSVDTANGVCSWQSSGVCTWPVPSSDSNANIDDLWHAAVNGRGTYFSAKDPATLASGLTGILKEIVNVPRAGTAAAAASSNPNVSTSDNYVFSSSYESVTWWGEVTRQQIDASGSLSVPNWSAMRLLDCATTPWKANTSYTGSWDTTLTPPGPALNGSVFSYNGQCYVVKANYTSGASFDTASSTGDAANTQVINADEAAATKVPAAVPSGRTIFTKGSSGLIPFTWSSIGSTLQSYFKKPWTTYSSATAGLSQFCTPNSASNCLSGSAQAAADGQPLLDYLRGDRTNEGTYFRQRVHVLGDIVASEGRYVKTPLFNYSDPGYSAFKSNNNNRTGVVYVAANDGMLHAFDSATGAERWAYVPSMVIPNLYKLADMNYASQHQFFVDNTPEVGEICASATGKNCSGDQWKTIVVGGLNRGGKGYYALDVTDPTVDPVLLWEFTDTRLGYSYGNPRITKLKTGQWVVLLGSGYNNADGKGYLFVLDAKTGAPVTSINTDGTISTGASSGAVRISAHALAGDTDNTTTAVYGGDENGNLWRFDVNNDMGATGYDAQKLVSFVDASGNAQPITAKPVTATINGNTVVFVGTGRYLGTTDIGDTRTQSFYAVKDPGTATTYGNPRITTNGFVQQTMTAGTCASGQTACTQGQSIRTSSTKAIDWTTQNGWFVDFISGGERAATDASLGLGTLVFTTNLPSINSGTACGDPSKAVSNSYLYAFNYITGAAISGTDNVSGTSLGNGTVTRPVLIELADGSVRTLTRISNGTQGGNTVVGKPPIHAGNAGGLRRVSWRELTSQ